MLKNALLPELDITLLWRTLKIQKHSTYVNIQSCVFVPMPITILILSSLLLISPILNIICLISLTLCTLERANLPRNMIENSMFEEEPDVVDLAKDSTAFPVCSCHLIACHLISCMLCSFQGPARLNIWNISECIFAPLCTFLTSAFIF